MLWDVVHPDRAPDAELVDGQLIEVGGTTLRVLATPGHSPGGVCLYDEADGVVFSGDTLFNGGPGATGRSFSDYPTIVDSIRDRLLVLPAATRVLTGHGDETTIGAEAPGPAGLGSRPVSPTADLPTRARVVIVGGGVIGTSIAYHLTKLGWGDVVLLERDRLTSGTTWHAAGLITSAGMVDETALFMARYSRDLYERLEEETGLSTGFRAVGHISIATNEHRMEALRREALFVNGFGVEDQELSPAEIADLWPLLRTDDLVGGLYVADEGRADPVGVAMSLAKGARSGRCHHRRGVPGDRGDGRAGPGDGRGDRPGHHRVRVRGQRGRHVGPPVRRPRRRRRIEPGGRALLPHHRADGGRAPRPARGRGPRLLRLLPAGGRRTPGRALRAAGRGVGARRRARRLVLPRAAARLRAPGTLRRPRHGPGARARRHRDPQVLLRPRVVHLRRPSPARPGARSSTTTSSPPASTPSAS